MKLRSYALVMLDQWKSQSPERCYRIDSGFGHEQVSVELTDGTNSVARSANTVAEAADEALRHISALAESKNV